MPSAIDSLIARVSDPSLRAELALAAAELRKTTDFGLVFEAHLPETVRLHDHLVRRGGKVNHRRSEDKSVFEVVAIEGSVATLKRVRYANGAAVGTDESVESEEAPIDQLIVVAEFGDPIHPGLRRLDGSIASGGDKPAHVVINGENYHTLQALQFTHAGKIDCIYIDPPYNTGARDWKYDNDYVDDDDDYRHSKWLAFMDRRLKLAKGLLNPDSSVLIVTIDEKEYLRLGMLLGQVFPGSRVQMVSIVINPKGTGRANEFSRVDEYAFFVFQGDAVVPSTNSNDGATEVRWKYLRRTDIESDRGTKKGGPRQFYPIYVDEATHRIVKLGEPLAPDDPLDSAPAIEGAVPVFPIREDGRHMNWGLIASTLQKAIDGGYVRVTPGYENQPYIISYLSVPNQKKAESGEYSIIGTREDGSKVVVIPGGKASRPTTAWREKAHDAGAHGTSMLGSLLPGRKFPYPKSLYAVEDCIRLATMNKPNSVVLDFFAGSGTTTHAVARLNKQDGGRRQSILVTNNEVSEAEARRLSEDGYQPGDPEWEAVGIFEHITRPRVTAAITGQTPEGDAIADEYKFNDKFPMADGLAENVEYFKLTYQDAARVELDMAFEAVAPLLWLRAGGIGPIIADRRGAPYVWTDFYGVLFETDNWPDFVDSVPSTASTVFIVTDSVTEFSQIASELPTHIHDPVRLYERYLATFAINERLAQ